ncbi:MAG: DNA polymerase III subunit delta [Selenomonadaceae bacterium]|nr:DNA polymerase III subunit delta [Selenomonadaceae bacterium]
MKFNEFMSALDGEIKHVYLLCGEEKFFVDRAREKIFARLDVDPKTELTTFDGNTKPAISAIINAIDSMPFFGDKIVVLVKNAEKIFGGDFKSPRLESVLGDMQRKNFVIFTAKTADKRRKFYKLVSKVGEILEADPLRPWEIGDWLNAKLKSLGKTMTRDALQHFNERLGILPEISLWHLNNELDKVALNVTARQITAEDLRKNLLTPPEVSDFALTDAVDDRKVQKALYLLRLQARVPAKLLLATALLVRHVRQLIRAKFFMARGIKGRRLGEPLEMNPYIAQKVGTKAETYPLKLLESVFVELADADFKLKTGRGGVEVLERIVIKLCRR